MKHYLLTVATLIIFASCNQKQPDQEKNVKGHIDSLIVQDSIDALKIVSDHMNNIGLNMGLNEILSLEGMSPEEKTNITVMGYKVSDNPTLKNEKNRLQPNELYVELQVNYKFFLDKIKQYNNKDSVTTYFHVPEWILVDSKGTYYKSLTFSVQQPDSTLVLYFDSDSPSPSRIPFKVIDGFELREAITFKAPKDIVPSMLIYKKHHLSNNQYTSAGFILNAQ